MNLKPDSNPVPVLPVEAHIQVSNTCEPDCRHCPFFFDDRRHRLNVDEFRLVLETLVQHDIWHVLLIAPSCGEIQELPDIVATGVALGQDIELLVCGPMPQPRFWKELHNAELRTVVFQLFGTHKFHDAHSQRGSYKDTIKAINTAADLGIEAIATIRLLKGIEDDIGALVESLPSSIKGIVFQHFIPFKNNQEIFCMRDVQALKLWRLGKEKARPVPTRYSSCLRSNDPEETKICSVGRFKLAVDFDGTAVPCEHFQRTPQAILGNLLTDRLEDIWSAPLLEQIRHIHPDNYTGVCGRCPDRYRCTSCRALGFNLFGNVDFIVPACNGLTPRQWGRVQ